MKIPALLHVCHRSLCFSFTFLVLLGVLSKPAEAFNPPVDKAGPLTVRIEFPEVVDKVGVPVEGCVIIENEGKNSVSGQLKLEVIDRWTITPEGPTRFYVDAVSDSSDQANPDQTKPNITKIPFKATADEGTYSGGEGGNAIYYPIHAKATFTYKGETKTAHPIHLFRTTFPWNPVSLPLTWKPFVLGADQRLRLMDEQIHRTFVALQDKTKSPILKSIGFNGSDQKTGATFAFGYRQGTETAGRVLASHPPYRSGFAGTVVREYPVRLPESKPVKLDFGVGVSESEKGDGVTFRVRVAPADAPEGTLGEVVFDQHSNNQKGWDECRADLSRFAGREVRVQLETDPGPKGNTGWDSCFWSKLLLTAGTPAPVKPFPPVSDEGFARLGEIQSCGHTYTVQVRPGNRGLLDADVGFVREDGQKLYFRGFQIYYTGKRIDSGETSVRLLETTTQTGTGLYEVVHRFLGDHGPMDLIIRLQLKDNTLQVSFAQSHEKLKEAPAWTPIHLEDISTGPWSVRAEQIYQGFGNVIRNPEAYRLPFEGHHEPTSFVGFDFEDSFSMVQAVDNAPTGMEVRPEERHYSLHVPYCPTLTFIPTHDAFQGAKRWREVNGLKASAGVPNAAGRFVFDLWGGQYEASQKQLEKAFRYGLSDSMVVWHAWQRWGYDYRLPEIYPPNPGCGTEKEMQALIQTCKAAGVPFALHDNYIDFYPDAEGFSYEKHVGFNPDGKPRRAWFNEGRDALSYRYNPRNVMQFLMPNLKLIRDNLAPTAYFIDVWSSIGPGEYWTSTGQLVTGEETKKIWGEAFAWIRDLLGNNAPQISESGHDQLIGYLDGAQTNHLRIESDKSFPWCVIHLGCQEHERICWFDVAHHDRFILHGAGYSSRYPGGLDVRVHGIDSDDYIATEVLTGHPGMVASPFSDKVVRKYWLLAPLMRALALRTVEQVDFDGGKNGNLHRQHVTWSGGAQVWVNRDESDWKVEDCTLPQYGFLARVPTKDGTVEARIERRDDMVIEKAVSPKHLYVSARPISDLRLKAKLLVEKVEREGDHLKIGMKAVIQEKAPEGYQLFFHIDSGKEKNIVEQPAHDGLLFSREPGEYHFTITSALPSYAKPGDELFFSYGLWDPSSGRRHPLMGSDDGSRRVCLGVFNVLRQKDKETAIDVNWEASSGESSEIVEWRKRFNQDNRMVDFGSVVTNGGCRLTKDSKGITVTPLPIKGVPLQTIQIRPSQLPWDASGLTRIVSLDEEGKEIAERRISGGKDGALVEIKHTPDVFEYRLLGE